MDWRQTLRHASGRGLTVAFAPATFLGIGTTGIQVTVFPWQESSGRAEVVQHEELDAEEDRLLAAVLRLCRAIDPGFPAPLP